MKIIYIYAIGSCSIFVIFFLFALRSHLVRSVEYLVLLHSKYLTYPHILSRHVLLGPWTPAGFFIHLAYIAVNGFCLCFRVSSTSQASIRAANLSLLNMMPLFLGTHLSFLADLFGISLQTFRRIHRLAGMMAFVLLLLHVLVVVAGGLSFSVTKPEDLSGLIGGSALCLLLLLSIPILRKPSYELFLRSHQALAALVAGATLRHVMSTSDFHWPYVYIFAGTFIILLVVQCGIVLFRNTAWGRQFPRAYITHINHTVMIRMVVPRLVDIAAGQHVSVWIPSVSFWSFFQSHPFVVTNWAEGKQDTLELFIQPRRGLTHEFYTHGTLDARDSVPRLALFSGPHGISIPVGEYETVLMIATGFGIAAQLPYLRELIHGYNTCKTRTRRVHLVWQLQTIEIGLAAESLLNNALDEDTLDNGYILCISIYVESRHDGKVPFGRRATIHPGAADMEEILEAEVTGKFIKRVQETPEERGKMLVIVSGTPEVRDRLRALVRPHLDKGVRLEEIEYQPE